MFFVWGIIFHVPMLVLSLYLATVTSQGLCGGPPVVWWQLGGRDSAPQGAVWPSEQCLMFKTAQLIEPNDKGRTPKEKGTSTIGYWDFRGSKPSSSQSSFAPWSHWRVPWGICIGFRWCTAIWKRATSSCPSLSSAYFNFSILEAWAKSTKDSGRWGVVPVKQRSWDQSSKVKDHILHVCVCVCIV